MSNPPPDGIRAVDGRRHSFFIVENRILDECLPTIGHTPFVVYCCLARLASGRDQCYPSIAYLAKAVGLSERTINRSLEVLVENGLISIEKRTSAEGRQTSNLYRLLPKVDASVGSPVEPKETPAQRLVRRTVCELVPNEKPLKKEFIAAAALLERYEEETLVRLYGTWAQKHDPHYGGYSLTVFGVVVGGLVAKSKTTSSTKSTMERVKELMETTGVTWAEASEIVRKEVNSGKR